jgi:diadenylate cyclase
VEFSATSLRELCKMDGAVVLSSEGTRIIRAAVHLMPDPDIPTEESGTRHRTADRVARQTGFPVISVSQSMHLIGLYLNGQRHVLDDSTAIMSRANQALATLERYKLRLDEVSGTLSALEIEDLVTVRDAVTVVQRLEMVRRIADEIAGYVVELGTDGRLLALQLDELMSGVDADRTLVVRDYLPGQPGPDRQVVGRSSGEALEDLDLLSANDLIDLVSVAKALGHPGTADALDAPVTPRGFRLLAKVPRLPGPVVDRLVDHFGSLQRLLGATVDDLQAVGGVGETRARGVREGLSRLAEASILERYV